jgi:TonB family protein
MKSALFAALLLVGLSLSASAQSADDVYTKVDERPEPLKTVAPVHPAGQSGIVAVSCVIDENGKVLEVHVTKSTNTALDSHAMAALQSWSFKPAKVAGKPVKTKVTVPFRFEGEA